MIEDLIGVPFKRGGRDKKGLDCYGVCVLVYERMGKKLPDYDSPEDESIIAGLIDENKPWFEKIDRPEPYCFVLFNVRPPYSAHIGLMLDDTKFLHCSDYKPVCIERITHPLWEKRIVGFYRWPN